jgi:hypothetical protein
LEDDSTYIPNRVPRYQRDYESDYESPTEKSSANQDDDSLPDLVLPSIDLDDDGPSTPGNRPRYPIIKPNAAEAGDNNIDNTRTADTQAPDRPADSEESNHASSTKAISDYIYRDADSEFAIQEIIVPTRTEARTYQAQSQPSRLSISAPDVGSHHEQILAS